jgi:DinB superfamily
MITTNEIAIKMILNAWTSHINQTDSLLNKLSDEELAGQVAPGKNTGVYLLGHLTAVHDGMIPLLGLGDPFFPQLEEVFIKEADNSGLTFPSTQELRKYWRAVNHTLDEHFTAMKTDVWFMKHNAVSEEDFAKEPHRNRLNIVVNRTNHLAWHLGQLTFLKK